MSNEVFWTRFISLVIILGVVKTFFIPIFFPSAFNIPWENWRGFLFNLVLHLSVLSGFVYFLFRGGKFKRKEFSIWTIIGVFMVGFSVLPLVQRVYIGSYFTEPLKVFFNEFVNMSELTFYGLGFGLWVAFFEIGNRKELLFFLTPLVLVSIIVILPFSLIYHLHWTSFGVGYDLNQGNIILPYGFRLWVFPKCMWNMWFWAELFIRYSLALFLSLRVFNVHIKNLKFMQKSQKLSY